MRKGNRMCDDDSTTVYDDMIHIGDQGGGGKFKGDVAGLAIVAGELHVVFCGRAADGVRATELLTAKISTDTARYIPYHDAMLLRMPIDHPNRAAITCEDRVINLSSLEVKYCDSDGNRITSQSN